jgi:hypothetical protein
VVGLELEVVVVVATAGLGVVDKTGLGVTGGVGNKDDVHPHTRYDTPKRIKYNTP